MAAQQLPTGDGNACHNPHGPHDSGIVWVLQKLGKKKFKWKENDGDKVESAVKLGVKDITKGGDRRNYNNHT